MSHSKTAKSALISVFHKDGLAPIVKKLNEQGVKIYSTGGTETFIKNLGIEVVPVEDVTSYPSILGGRVKTLHPKVFGGILNRQDHINLLGDSPLAFKGVSKYGERFVDMSEPYDKKMSDKLRHIAKENNIPLHDGVYASVVGPQLETKAEYRYLKIIGADAVGMSTVPEIIVANHLNLPVVAVSVLTDECDPDHLKPVNIKEIMAMAAKAEPHMIRLFKELIKDL